MAFNVHIERSPSATILVLSGRLTIGNAAAMLHEAVEQRLAAGETNIIFDLRSLTYVDSCGMGAMVTCLTSAKHRGGSVRLANVPKRIQDLLAVSSLHTIFSVVEFASDTAGGR